MFESTLLYPDHASWQAEAGYSDDARGDLNAAYQHLRQGAGRTAGFLHAARRVERWIGQRISAHQRMHVYYVYALAHAADEGEQRSLYWIDQALSLAGRLRELGDQAELLRLRASLYRSTLEFEEAAEDLKLCLALLDETRDRLGVDDPAARLEVLPQLATYEFFLARFDSSERLLEQARALVPLVNQTRSLDMATIEWTQAKLHHLRGMPEMAMRYILPAADVYAREANAISYERLEIDAAEFALTWAQSRPVGSDRNALIALARSHLVRAERIARERQDLEGAALARLTRARMSRLTRGSHDRVGVIEAVIKQGRALDDIAIVAQGLTALGDEFASRDERDSALNCYSQAIQSLDGSQVPMLAIQAQRALGVAGEMGWGGKGYRAKLSW